MSALLFNPHAGQNLPIGATSRKDVEVLLSLDRIERVDRDWPGYLTRTVSEFVLSTSEPRGVVDAETANWLAPILSDARPRTASAIIRTLTGEAHQVDEALVAFVRKGAKPRREETRPAEHRTAFHLQESATCSEASGDPVVLGALCAGADRPHLRQSTAQASSEGAECPMN